MHARAKHFVGRRTLSLTTPAELSPDEPAIRLARRDFPTLHPEQTIGEALNSFRGKDAHLKILYLYVTDRDGKLLGVLPSRHLLTAALDARVDQLYLRKVESIPSSATLREARESFAAHQFLALPIVDEVGRLQGVIDIRPFAGKLEDIHQRTSFEDVFEMLGLPGYVSEEAPAWTRFRARFPWLTPMMVSGVLCALLSSHFQATLEARITLVFFLTLTLDLNEAVCMQSATLTIQSLHGRSPSEGYLRHAARRELGVAAMLGSACAVAMFVLVVVWQRDLQSATIIGVSLLGSIIASCLWGLLVPTVLRRFKADPRMAAAPIALGLTDLSALALYFGLAKHLFG